MIADALATIEDEEQRNKLAEFYSKHKQRLYSIAFSKLHNEEDAEDAVQEVFSEIADKPEKFFDIAPEGRLAYTTVMVKNISVIFVYPLKNLLSAPTQMECRPRQMFCRFSAV